MTDKLEERVRSSLQAMPLPTAPDALYARVGELANRRSEPRHSPRLRLAWSLAVLAASLVVLLGMIALAPGTPVNSPGPTATAPPTGVATPSVFVPSAWELRSYPAPDGHPDVVVLGATADASEFLFQDAGTYDHLYLSGSSGTEEVALPGHDVGTPIFARMSPSGSFAIVQAAGSIWRLAPTTGTVTQLPGVPEGTGVQWFDFLGDSRLVIVEAVSDTPIHPTQVWTLELATGRYSKLGSRTDVTMAFGTDRGVIVVVDESARHDNLGWHLYLASADGADELLFDATGATLLAVSPDGKHAALSFEATVPREASQPGVELVDLVTGRSALISNTGVVRSFSPDSAQVAVADNGSLRAYDLAGAIVGTAAVAERATWVGRAWPSPSHLAVSPSCEPPPTIVFGENGTPIPIVLTCDKAVAEAFAHLPANVGGPFGGSVTAIEFHYGRYCPPGWRCGPFAGQGDLGFVLFGLADGSSGLAEVRADPTGLVTVTSVQPTPTHPPTEPLAS